MAIVTEKLQKHEESRPGFLSRELAARLELVRAVYPADHPNYPQLWVDMLTRMTAQPRLAPAQVKLADLWLRERVHLEHQLLACRYSWQQNVAKFKNIWRGSLKTIGD